MRRSMLILVSAGLACVLASVRAAGAVTFSDSTFDESDWTHTVLSRQCDYAHTCSSGEYASASAHQVADGGNPGAYRSITTSLPDAPADLMIVVEAISLKKGATYDPRLDGAIVSIDYSEDDIGTSCSGAGCLCRCQGTGPALYQNGKYYYLSSRGLRTPSAPSAWQHGAVTGLVATDFVTTESGADHPDFSVTGSPIAVGFRRTNSTGFGTPGYEVTAGIDNWTLVVHPQEPVDARHPSWGAIKTLYRGGRVPASAPRSE